MQPIKQPFDSEKPVTVLVNWYGTMGPSIQYKYTIVCLDTWCQQHNYNPA